MKEPDPPHEPAYDAKELLIPLLNGAPIIINPRKWHRVCFATDDSDEDVKEATSWMLDPEAAEYAYATWGMEVLQRNNTTARIVRIVTEQHSFGLLLNTDNAAVTVKAARELAAAVYQPQVPSGEPYYDPSLYLIARLPAERVDE
jgi:hypothetical protein